METPVISLSTCRAAFDRVVMSQRRSLLGHLCLITVLMIFNPAGFAQAKTLGLVVNGLGGNPEYSESFSASADTIATALESLDGAPDTIVRLGEDASRENILDAIESLGSTLLPSSDTSFVLVLVGHGSATRDTWRFNVTGPDLSTEDLVASLNVLPSSKQLLVLAASASGAALDTLSQAGRVVVTATKSGGEINAVRFPEYLAEAMSSSIADYDRNEILTIAEAYRYAESRTREYYEQQKLLASEHSRFRGNDSGDVAIALLGSLKQAKDDPVVTALLEERLVLEDEFRQLTARKKELSTVEFYEQLETLLISIATLQQSIDEATGWSDPDADS